jgi:hypothetical protein
MKHEEEETGLAIDGEASVEVVELATDCRLAGTEVGGDLLGVFALENQSHDLGFARGVEQLALQQRQFACGE